MLTRPRRAAARAESVETIAIATPRSRMCQLFGNPKYSTPRLIGTRSTASDRASEATFGLPKCGYDFGMPNFLDDEIGSRRTMNATGTTLTDDVAATSTERPTPTGRGASIDRKSVV